MNLGLQGKHALILGGGSGLGFATAAALAAEGVCLTLLGRQAERLQHAAQRLQEFGVTVHCLPADLADPAQVTQALLQLDELPPVDILLNNGGGPPPCGAAGIPLSLWQAQFQSLVLSLVQITDHVLPGMRARGWGRILTVASTTVEEPNPALALSNSLRSTLVGWCKTLASEVAADGVTVNMLLPGLINTDRSISLTTRAAEEAGVGVDAMYQQQSASIPLRRFGEPGEFGAVAAFLASQQASYVTGSMIRVDGGKVHHV